MKISVNEATYIQTQRSDVPYLITKITDIKVTKAGHAEFVTRPFHRYKPIRTHQDSTDDLDLI